MSVCACASTIGEKKRKEKKNYAGSKMLPASIKEEESLRPEVPESPPPMEKITSGDLEGGRQPLTPDQGLQSNLFFQVRGFL